MGLLTLANGYASSYEDFERQFQAFKTNTGKIQDSLRKQNLNTQDIEIIYQDIKKSVSTGETLTHNINGVAKQVYQDLKKEKGLGTGAKKSEAEIRKIEYEIYIDRRYSICNEIRFSIHNILYGDYYGSFKRLFDEKVQEFQAQLRSRNTALDSVQKIVQEDLAGISIYQKELCKLENSDTDWNDTLFNINKNILHTQNHCKWLQSSLKYPPEKIHFFSDESQFEEFYPNFKEVYKANDKFKEYNSMFIKYLNSLNELNDSIKMLVKKTEEIKKIIETLEKDQKEKIKKLLDASKLEDDYIVAELPQ